MAPRRPFWIELWRFPSSFSIWYWYAHMQNTGLIPWKMWTWMHVNWKKQNGHRRPFWISWTWLWYLFSILGHKQPFCTILNRFEIFYFFRRIFISEVTKNGHRAAILNLIMAVIKLIQRLVLIYLYAKYKVDSRKNVDLNASQLKN